MIRIFLPLHLLQELLTEYPFPSPLNPRMKNNREIILIHNHFRYTEALIWANIWLHPGDAEAPLTSNVNGPRISRDAIDIQRQRAQGTRGAVDIQCQQAQGIQRRR